MICRARLARRPVLDPVKGVVAFLVAVEADGEAHELDATKPHDGQPLGPGSPVLQDVLMGSIQRVIAGDTERRDWVAALFEPGDDEDPPQDLPAALSYAVEVDSDEMQL